MASPKVLTQSIVGYYVALRISAAAATTWLPFEPRADPSPIVRSAIQPFTGGFDYREVVASAETLHIVTLPARLAVRAAQPVQHPILPN